MSDLLIATGNAHKVQEIQAILDRLAVKWRTTREFDPVEVEENGADYAANAAIKAKFWAERTGLWTIGDDSGLEVEALGGRPGLYSARYAGPGENPLAKLLGELQGVPIENRRARFVCVACLCGPNSEPLFFEGEVRGRIALETRGEGGFGFDPLFIPDEGDGRHLAQFADSEKNAISHRGRAFRAARESIQRLVIG